MHSVPGDACTDNDNASAAALPITAFPPAWWSLWKCNRLDVQSDYRAGVKAETCTAGVCEWSNDGYGCGTIRQSIAFCDTLVPDNSRLRLSLSDTCFFTRLFALLQWSWKKHQKTTGQQCRLASKHYRRPRIERRAWRCLNLFWRSDNGFGITFQRALLWSYSLV